MNAADLYAWITTPPEWDTADEEEDEPHYTSECGDCNICGVIE